ncbi:heavy-metal-associated domain-containing protein [Actinotalea ferrariae]|nr:heavy-metal-associated domain-containing protein [Actinotalea ferrariae]
MEITYGVEGMTCGHCASSVTAELRKVPEVQDVTVDVASGTVTIASRDVLDEAVVAHAVSQAGYAFSGHPA